MIEESLSVAYSLKHSPHKQKVAQILDAALEAVDPYQVVRRIASSDGNSLLVSGETFRLADFDHIYLVSFGKAAFPMAKALQALLGPRLTNGIVTVKDGYLPADKTRQTLDRIRLFKASHPIPDRRGIQAAEAVIELLQRTTPDDLVICAISGGGSALLCKPVSGVSLGDLQALTGLLLKSGAAIAEINTLRKHLDEVKGGGLARFAQPAEVITLILSDVVGDPLDAIASGPTVPDPGRFQDCWSILERYQLLEAVPTSIKHHILRGLSGEIPETMKADEPIFKQVHNFVIANNLQAAAAAQQKALQLGFFTEILTTQLQGEAQAAGEMVGTVLKQLAARRKSSGRPACTIAGGETTVTVRGDGVGGRNLEVALGSIFEINSLEEAMIITLATDGGDGPTDAAGAVVTGETLQRAAKIGLDPQDILDRNNSYTFFEALGDLIKIGPTQTNVNDLVFMFSF